MTEGRVSRVFRRASDKWDRGRVPPAFDAGTIWERIQQGSNHIGARRRIITHLADSLLVEETLALAEAGFVGSWHGSLSLTAPPEPTWTSYSFAIGDGEPVSYTCEDETTIPRFALYPVLVRIPFEAGHLKAIRVLDDRTGRAADESHLVSVGWDEAINGQWWRVDQYHEGEKRAAYWLDAQHRLMRSDWEGAVLVVAESRAAGLGDLADVLDPIFGGMREEDPAPQ